MTPIDPISDADLELVSAYLDTQLAPGEQASLEARFGQDAALRQARDDLQATVALLGQLAPAPPPRSFTLDPAAFAARRAWQLPATWMRVGSLFATLLLAATFTFSMTNTAAPAAAITVEQEDYSSAAAATLAPAIAATTAPAAAALEVPAAPGVTAAPAAAMSAPAAEATAAPAAAPETGEPSAADEPEAGSASRAAASDTTGAAADTTTITALEAAPPREVAPPTRRLTVLQIALAVAALGLLLGSFVVARRA